MTDTTFPCPACGGPNEPVGGESRMACTYCGANLTIPAELRTKPKPTAKIKPPKTEPRPRLEKEAPDLLREVQPYAVKALNAYAAWTWLRRILPGCLILLVLFFAGCVALGALPLVLGLLQ